MKIITGTSGRINELLKGIPNEEFVSSSPFGDGKVMIVVKGEVGVIGKVQTVEKIVEVDNPKLIKKIGTLEADIIVKTQVINNYEFSQEELNGQIQTLQDALGDALNAEQAAKKEAEDLKKQIPKLKASVAKLKKALITED